jgi:hypothetical protein
MRADLLRHFFRQDKALEGPEVLDDGGDHGGQVVVVEIGRIQIQGSNAAALPEELQKGRQRLPETVVALESML